MILRNAEEEPDLDEVLDALDDPAARAIIQEARQPMSAGEIAEACDIPLSTTYRKLELLSDATLLREETELRLSGRHRSQYRVAFERVGVELSKQGTLDLDISRPPADQFAAMWSEVRREA
ncbi:helix-turn-helix domain-containing protein [Halobacteriaceae archaeon GCM10025711]